MKRHSSFLSKGLSKRNDFFPSFRPCPLLTPPPPTHSLRFLSQKAPAVNVLIKQHLNIFQMSDMQRDKASLVFQAGQKREVHY